VAAVVWSIAPLRAHALGEPHYVANSPATGAFALVNDRIAAPILVSGSDWLDVIRAVGDLSSDINRATGFPPSVLLTRADLHVHDVVIIGTSGMSPLIEDLIRSHKLDVRGVAGKWESAVTTIVHRPILGVRHALVIAGSGKRGAIFGIYDLSEQIGISPWYWWADARVQLSVSQMVFFLSHSNLSPVNERCQAVACLFTSCIACPHRIKSTQ
jgi:hypothetical protein